MTRGVVVFALMLAACGRPPVRPTSGLGDSRERAAPMQMETHDRTLWGEASGEVSRARSRWHFVDLTAQQPGTLRLTLNYDGPPDTMSVELLDSDGTKVAIAPPERPLVPGQVRSRGSREIVADRIAGQFYAHITGAGTYELFFTFVSDPVQVDAGAKCDTRHVDPNDPACAGIKPCDPNKPDMTNPTCCDVVCFTDRACSRHLLPVDDPDAPPNAVWLDMGAKDGLHRRYRGWVDYTASDGKTMQVSLDIVDIQDSRSMIYLPKPPDKTRLQYGGAHIRPPDECIHGR